MKRRLFAMLTVPALALSFAVASPDTDQAQAYPFPSIHQMCAFVAHKMATAEYYGDWASYDSWYAQAEALGCIADPEDLPDPIPAD